MLPKWSKIALLFSVFYGLGVAQSTFVSLSRSVTVAAYGGGEGTIDVSLVVTKETVDPAASSFPLSFQGTLSGHNLGNGGEAMLVLFRNGVEYGNFASGSIYKFDAATIWKSGDVLELAFTVTGTAWPIPSSQRLSYTVGSSSSQRTVAYKFEVTNTTLQPRTVTIQVGSSDVRAESVPAYQNRTIEGQLTAVDGTTVALVAGVELFPKSGLPYDPFLVSVANTTLERAYFIGNDPTKLVQCTLVAGVAKANSSVQDGWVEIRAGSAVLLRGNVVGNGTDFQWFKVSIPLPVGTEPALITQETQTPFEQPVPGTVAANNTELRWLSEVGGPVSRNWNVTSYNNGTMILETPPSGAPGSSGYQPGQTVQVNTNQLPNNGTGASLGQGVVGQSGTSPNVPGVTVITGPNAGNGTSGGNLVDTGLLQTIANNTSQIAQNTNTNADGLSSDMPSTERLKSFTPDNSLKESLQGMNPLVGKNIPAAEPPSISLPFGQLGIEGMNDKTVDFTNTDLSRWASTMRGFFLFCVSALFSFNLIKLISKTFGNI